MNLLCNSELFYSISEETVEELKLLIKQAIDVIQSLVNHVPPLVVDCSPHPDINSGAYPGKKVAGLEAEKYVTTQSALFYSYKGQSVAKTGELSPIASISKDVLGQYMRINLHAPLQAKRDVNTAILSASEMCINARSFSKQTQTDISQNSIGTQFPLKQDLLKKPLHPVRKGRYNDPPTQTKSAKKINKNTCCKKKKFFRLQTSKVHA